MSGFLLDTDISSYVIRSRPETLRGRFERHAHEIQVSAITAAELRFGSAKASSRKVADIVEAFLERVPILDWTSGESWLYAETRAAMEKKGTPIGGMDLLIATHALSRKLTLVTNKAKHFSSVPRLKVEIWT